MTIPRVWLNGLVVGVDTLTSAAIAALDVNFQRAVDKSSLGESISGGLAAIAAGTGFSIDTPTGVVPIQGGFTVAETQSGARIVCGDQDVPFFSASRTRTVVGNFDECMNMSGAIVDVPYFGANWTWQRNTLTSPYPMGHGLSATDPQTQAIIPLTRVHHGATLTSVSAYFIVNRARIGGSPGLPSAYPNINVYRLDPFLGVISTLRPNIAAIDYPTQATMTAYANSGNPNTLTYTCTVNNVIDVTKYLYFLYVQDENYGGSLTGNENSWIAYSTTCTVPDMTFQ